jgi:transposase
VSEGDGRSLGQDAQEALRVRGVKLLVEGWTQAAVGDALGVSDRVVQRWWRRYRRGGWKAVAKQRRGRRAGEQQALSGAVQQRLAGQIAGSCPDQLQIPGLLWTRSAVRALIERECGVRLDLSTVGRYLRAWGFSLKRPVTRALEQDPVVVQAWLDDVLPSLQARAKAEGALILWGDESGVRLHELAPTAGYAPVGVRAVARTAGRRAGTNMISAIANSGQMSFRVFDGRFTAGCSSTSSTG